MILRTISILLIASVDAYFINAPCVEANNYYYNDKDPHRRFSRQSNFWK